jgi:hypothetical protein
MTLKLVLLPPLSNKQARFHDHNHFSQWTVDAPRARDIGFIVDGRDAVALDLEAPA